MCISSRVKLLVERNPFHTVCHLILIFLSCSMTAFKEYSSFTRLSAGFLTFVITTILSMHYYGFVWIIARDMLELHTVT